MSLRCLNCKIRAIGKARGLCHACYDDLKIRQSYPLQTDRHVGVGRSNKSLPASNPVNLRPGSIEKIEVMSERASRNESLFHPLDRDGDDELI